ncbi:unnamed protein product [Amoebophrya sp. A120]|nr:unnamed protein product [Amoebophrya sp. A120]|eukprot:GSA120T00015381001.1
MMLIRKRLHYEAVRDNFLWLNRHTRRIEEITVVQCLSVGEVGLCPQAQQRPAALAAQWRALMVATPARRSIMDRYRKLRPVPQKYPQASARLSDGKAFSVRDPICAEASTRDPTRNLCSPILDLGEPTSETTTTTQANPYGNVAGVKHYSRALRPFLDSKSCARSSLSLNEDVETPLAYSRVSSSGSTSAEQEKQGVRDSNAGSATKSSLQAGRSCAKKVPAFRGVPPEVLHSGNPPRRVHSPPNARVIRVALIGLPNAGKSSLLNACVGGIPVAAVSQKVNTTNTDEIRGVYTSKNVQVLFQDAPGILPIRPKHRELARKAWDGYKNADLVLLVVDVVRRPTSEFFGLLRKLAPLPLMGCGKNSKRPGQCSYRTRAGVDDSSEAGSSTVESERSRVDPGCRKLTTDTANVIEPRLPRWAACCVAGASAAAAFPRVHLNRADRCETGNASSVPSKENPASGDLSKRRKPFVLSGQEFLLREMGDAPQQHLGAETLARPPGAKFRSSACGFGGSDDQAGTPRNFEERRDGNFTAIVQPHLVADFAAEQSVEKNFNDDMQNAYAPRLSAEADAGSAVQDANDLQRRARASSRTADGKQCAGLAATDQEQLSTPTCSGDTGGQTEECFDPCPELTMLLPARLRLEEPGNEVPTYVRTAAKPLASQGGATSGNEQHRPRRRPPVVLVLNKIDKEPEHRWVAARRREITARASFDKVFLASALENRGIESLLRFLVNHANQDDATLRDAWLYPAEQKTSLSKPDQVKQSVRAVLMTWFHKDVPYKVDQEVVGWWELDGDRDISRDEDISPEQDVVGLKSVSNETVGALVDKLGVKRKKEPLSGTQEEGPAAARDRNDTMAVSVNRAPLGLQRAEGSSPLSRHSENSRAVGVEDGAGSSSSSGGGTVTGVKTARDTKRTIVIEHQLTVSDSVVARMICGVGGRLLTRLRENVAFQLEKIWGVQRVDLRITVKSTKSRLSRLDLRLKAAAIQNM